MFPETRTVTAGNELDERYTLRSDIDWCLKRVGITAFDLDVAACAESHHAPKYLTREQNGLCWFWHGNIWCNPPYSDIAPWVTRAWEATRAERNEAATVAMLLPATRTEQDWWQRDIEPFRDGRAAKVRRGPWSEPSPLMGDWRYRSQAPTLETHFLPGRTRFGLPGNPTGIGVGSPPFACVLLIWRRIAA